MVTLEFGRYATVQAHHDDIIQQGEPNIMLITVYE